MSSITSKSAGQSGEVDHLLTNLRINQLSPSATNWFLRLIHILDAKDLDAYISFMAPHISVIFNNGDGTPAGMTMRGLEAVRNGLAQFWQTFNTLRHEELNIYGSERNFVHEALNRYTTLDGREVALRACAWIDRDEQGRITSLRVYGDQSALFR